MGKLYFEKLCSLFTVTTNNPIIDSNYYSTVILRFGKLIYDNGEYYEGEWMRGKRHGKGIYVYIDGSRFEGSWENDRINGEGTSWYPNGNRYQGEWSSGRINGRGKKLMTHTVLYGFSLIVSVVRYIILSKWR
jgi:hypothetical protein